MSDFALGPLPDSFAATREHLHQIAFFALGPTRYQAVGRMGLRHQPGGFGTPDFDGRTARVEGDLLVHQDGDSFATRTISSVRDAAEFFGNEYDVEWFSEFRDPLTPLDPEQQLDIDPEATEALGQWFAFAWVVLEELRSHAVDGDDPSEVQLWPEHFDAAAELGDQSLGQRASYGASPGDDGHPEPYIYVAAWSEIDRSNPYWNDESFNGSSLSYQELIESDDPTRKAVDFYLEGHRILHG